MEAIVYKTDGKKSGTVTLPEKLFGLRWNADLVHQVVTSLMSNRRANIAHTKDRSEVRGGGAKPWRQKGTGRARHGSIRSPIWVGGGVTHGPRKEKNYARKVSKQMRTKALHTILSRKYREGEVLFVDSVTLAAPKTKEAVKALQTLAEVNGFEKLFSKKRNAAVILLSKKDRALERSFRNLGNIEIIEARNLDPVTALQYKFLIIEKPEEAFEVLPGKRNKS